MAEETASDKRMDKIEDAISRLTTISADLQKMLAVNEQRLIQQEKQVTSLEEVIEKRREESELKLKAVYDTIRVEDKNILEELNRMRTEANLQHEKLSLKITEMQKVIWIYMGGFALIAFLISYGAPIIKILAGANASGGGTGH